MQTIDYLLDKKIQIIQPVDGYRASSDAVLLSSLINNIKKDSKILDVGSGTGAITLCIAHRICENTQIIGLELQANLVKLSNQSAKINGFDGFLSYIEHNIKNNITNFNNSFDICVTNPPYSELDMKSPKEGKALAHNHNDMNLESWCKFCLKMLKPNGTLYMIHRTEALDDIIYYLHGKAGDINIIPIFSKPNEEAKRVMIIAKKASKAPLKINKGLLTHNSDGSNTEQANKILRDGISFFDL